MMRHYFLFGACALLMRPVEAQQQGIHFILPEWDNVYLNDGLPSMAMGVGYARQVAPRLSYAVDFTVITRSFFSLDEYAEKEMSYGSYSAYYTEDRGGFAFTYRTAYMLDDPDNFSPYIGTSIGIMRVSRELEITSQYWDYYYYGYEDATIWKGRYEEDATLFPVQLRLGFRMPLEGFYCDFFSGIGYMIGGGDNLFPQRELEDVNSEIGRLTWTLGYAMGVGW
jgi:hypothetical protein